MKNGKRAVRKSSVILKGQPPVDPDRNRQALDSRGGFDFYIYKSRAAVFYSAGESNYKGTMRRHAEAAHQAL